MSFSKDEIIEGIKVVTAAAIPLAIAFGVSGADVQALSDAATEYVVAGSALIVAARTLAKAIKARA